MHMTIHTGERPYKKRDRTNSGGLKTHMMIHTGGGDRTTFNQRGGLKTHHDDNTEKRTMHTHMMMHNKRENRTNRHMTKIQERDIMHTHTILHSGERLYKCKRIFKFSGDLERHMMLHTEETLEKCDRSDTHDTYMREQKGAQPFRSEAPPCRSKTPPFPFNMSFSN
ncbi:hypothetical protein DPMN_138281 [Dreissena polymorpha]|uniref:Uncharacterized protein n=1 Tax=Dreissena polymorpha TaxID=45954 RepID=A0A9D4JH50_DREPO|nr:hypothetical protein DPMN_138281 [Dreissena polymorpha]